MSTNVSSSTSSSIPSNTPGSVSEPVPAPDSSVALTPEQVIQHLRDLRARIPEYAQLTKAEVLKLRMTASVDPAFVQATINAAGASEPLRTALGSDVGLQQRDHELAARWTAVAEELAAMLKGVRAAITVRKHRVGLMALQTYGVARQLVRNKANADLIPHATGMQALRKFRKRSGSAPAAGQGGTPVPAPARRSRRARRQHVAHTPAPQPPAPATPPASASPSAPASPASPSQPTAPAAAQSQQHP